MQAPQQTPPPPQIVGDHGAEQLAAIKAHYPPPMPSAPQAPSWSNPMAKAGPAPAHTGPSPRTQKAKGIERISAGHIPQGCVSPGPIRSLPRDAHYNITYPAFARPCPLTPRHGFVESRPVANLSQLMQVYLDAQRAEPGAELVVMQPLSGAFSAVATNAGVTWGLGHDGATGAGVDAAAVYIPTPGADPTTWNRKCGGAFYTDNGIIHDTAYVELVEHDGDSAVVQYRDGPAQSTQRDYIPRKETVGKVFYADRYTDLLAWERDIAAAKPGDVIYAPNSTLASHFAVHGIQHEIAVITSDPDGKRRPHPGDTLDPATAGYIEQLLPPHYYVLARRLNELRTRDYLPSEPPIHQDESTNKQTNAIRTALATIHSMSIWGGDHWALELRAQAVETLLRMSFAGVVGEARHWERRGPGSSHYDAHADDYTEVVASTTRIPRKLLMANAQDAGRTFWTVNTPLGQQPENLPLEAIGSGRHVIYRNMLLASATPYRIDLMLSLAEDFETDGWSDGYGGNAWATLARLTASTEQAAQAFIADPIGLRWQELVVLLNKLLNAMHNGGVIAEKWLNSRSLDAIAAAPAVGFMNSWAGAVVLDKMEILETQSTEVV